MNAVHSTHKWMDRQTDKQACRQNEGICVDSTMRPGLGLLSRIRGIESRLLFKDFYAYFIVTLI